MQIVNIYLVGLDRDMIQSLNEQLLVYKRFVDDIFIMVGYDVSLEKVVKYFNENKFGIKTTFDQNEIQDASILLTLRCTAQLKTAGRTKRSERI